MTPRQRFALCLPFALAAITLLIVVGRFPFRPATPSPVVPREPAVAPSRPARDSLRPFDHAGVADSSVPNDTALEQWQQLSRPSGSDAAERNQATCAALEDLATRDPPRALSLALAQADANLRSELLQAVLRGWARIDVDAAGAWALSQSHLEQDQAFAAIFNGAAGQPGNAIRFARQISRERPAQAAAYGQLLILALGRAGEHEKAAIFAAEGNADFAVDRLTAAYRQWSRQAPEVAALSAMTLKDPTLRFAAFQSAISVWAQADPKTLTEKAIDFSPGPERTFALSIALRAWVEKDLDAASAWVVRFEPTGGLSSVNLKLVLED